MKRIIFSATIILTFCLFVFGQTENNPNCPEIKVTGPASVVQPGETMTFTVIVGDLDWEKLEYDWSVDKGTIIEGQGMPVITVSTEGLGDTTVTANVKIKKLSNGCSDSGSETGVVAFVCSCAIAFDDFEKLSEKDEKARLYALASELKKKSKDSAYILLYHPANDKSKSYEDRTARIKNVLTKDRNISAERIIIIFAGEELEERTIIYLVPPDVPPPTP